MSYLVLARKYRPADFSTVSGQEHVTRTLVNAIKRDKVVHAFLFAGPRGVGKTSIARIFAKALNCEKGPTPQPCLKCTNCLEIAQGTSLAVREIDGASHNSVDNVRELIESFRSLPAPGSKHKIYIIDEVHMLSTSAFNALLKSLEEPPPHTVFILATTEAHKIPDTVVSRCQRHDFRALAPSEIEKSLAQIAVSEGIEVETEALRMIARLADGSMRDAQTLLDRVQLFCQGKITAGETSEVLGAVERSLLISLSKAVFSRDSAEALSVLQDAFAKGLNPNLFLREFTGYWQELLFAKSGGVSLLMNMGLNKQSVDELGSLVETISTTDLQDLVQLVREGSDAAIRSSYPKYAIEALLVRLATREPVKDIGAILNSLKKRVVAADNLAEGAVPNRERKESIKAVSAGGTDNVNQGQCPQLKETKIVNSLDWVSFVNYVGTVGQKMMVEQLKRLSVEDFCEGRLLLRAPEFSGQYFNRGDSIKQLQKLLSEYSDIPNWQVRIVTGVNRADAEPGSIADTERSAKKEARSIKENSIRKHTTIEKLKEVFPGSQIETIKFKE